MITCIKCGVPAAFQNIHKEPWTCIECQSHAAPNTPPTELDKAIEFKLELDNGKYTYIRYKQGGQEALRHGEKWRELSGDNLIYFMGCLIEEQAKRLKEVEKEGERKDREYAAIYQELSALRTEYKQALEGLKEIAVWARALRYSMDNEMPFPSVEKVSRMIARAEITTSTPLAIETMKGDQ